MIKPKVKSRFRVKKHLKKVLAKGTPEKPRLSVYRSLKNIYIQFIDDLSNRTLFSVSNLSKEVKEKAQGHLTKTEMSKLVGKVAAEIALSKGITTGVFDRNGFRYHGRVKALADGLREGGFKI
jgi:large subunit ribosomal protein L18